MGSSRIPRLLVHGTFAPLGLGWTALALVRPEDGPWPMALLLVALWLGLALVARRVGDRQARWILAVCSIALLLWPELALRWIGFRADQAGIIVFGAGIPENTTLARRDPELLWTLPPEVTGVNSHGFLGHEFEIPKPSDRYRMVFLGDSCTQQGYPELVARRLNRERRRSIATNAAGSASKLEESGFRREFEAINLGVAGYSSYQGRIAAERWLRPLAPDLTVIYFGWNDHWLAVGFTDADRGKPANRLMVDTLASSRVFQLAVRKAGPRRPKALEEPRVPLEDYRRNLEIMGETALATGSQLLLLTAPSAHPQAGVPDYLVEEMFARSKEEVLTQHRRYNDAVRALAHERGWPLLDLANRAASLEPISDYFKDDGIHFTPKGLHWIEAEITERIPGRRDGTSAPANATPNGMDETSEAPR
jgi:lysophospholipase L1-like esterase